jgi:ATP-dependent Clp protease ATP-binding subunit ClpA
VPGPPRKGRREAALLFAGVSWEAGGVFERFTERARQVVVLAQDEARSLRHNYIGTEHLLLGLIREEEGIAARVLAGLEVTAEEVRAQIERVVGRAEEEPAGQMMPFTPRAKKVLELALREALSFGHNDIGTEHVLLGLVREEGSVGTRILFDFGVDGKTIRNEVIRMLSHPASEAPRRRSWEYRVEWLAEGDVVTEELLRPLGADGWELAAVVGERLVFKRAARAY